MTAPTMFSDVNVCYTCSSMRIVRTLTLAALSLIAFVGSAVAQVGPAGGSGGSGSTLQCNASVIVTGSLRGEGYVEQVGDIALVCQGGTTPAVGAVIPQMNLTVTFNTAVTSRMLPVAGVSNAISEALLLVDEPGSR